MKHALGMIVLAGMTVLAGQRAGADDAGVVGPTTRQWLELQRSGQSAGPAQRLSGAAESRIYERYLGSFTHPIPEFFEERESFLAETDSDE